MTLRSIFKVFWVKILCSVRKLFFYVCYIYIYTFPTLSFHFFFYEFIELYSKLGLQRAHFWSWLPEQQNPQNLRAWCMQSRTNPCFKGSTSWLKIVLKNPLCLTISKIHYICSFLIVVHLKWMKSNNQESFWSWTANRMEGSCSTSVQSRFHNTALTILSLSL